MTTTDPLIYQSITSIDEVQQLGQLICQAFAAPPQEWNAYVKAIGWDNCRIIRRDDKILAGLAVYPMSQWYDGQCVSVAGIGAVAVTPEARGFGVGKTLMRKTLQDCHEAGFALSILYPATQTFYRQVGYGQGGSLNIWEAAAEHFPLGDRQLPLQAINPKQWELVEPIYRQKAQINNGNLDRHAAIWSDTLQTASEQTAYAYLIGEQDTPQGYVFFTQKVEQEQLTLTIQDWAVLSEAAARRLWTFCGDHRSMVLTIQWRGGPVDPYLRLWPEQTPQLKQRKIWMARIIDVTKALSERGYPQGISAQLDLEIHDPDLANNQGRFRLQVHEGKGEVIPDVGTGDLQLSIQTLASLFTGLYTPHQLALCSELKGSPTALAIAATLFAGPEPWLADFF